MYKRYKAAGIVLGAIFMASVGIQADAAQLGASLDEGIAVTFDQATNTEEQTQAAAEVIWTGTPLEGYVNIAIARVEDSLNIREAADTGSSLVGKLRQNGACEVLGYEGEWAHITSGDVEGYVKAEYLYTGQEAVDLAFQLGQPVAKVTTDALYVRMEPSTEADFWTMVPNGEELVVLEDMGDWVKVDIDGEEGYVASEFVEVSSELDTALTITEALYGEGVTDVRIDMCEFAKQYVGNRYVWGGTSLTKRSGLLRIYACRICQLWHFPSAFLQSAGKLRNKGQRRRRKAWRFDFLRKRKAYQSCGDVYWKRSGCTCQQRPHGNQNFQYVLQNARKRCTYY